MIYAVGAAGIMLMLDALVRGRPLFGVRHDGEEFLVGFVFMVAGLAL